MKRYVNPSVELLNQLYADAKQNNHALIERILRDYDSQIDDRGIRQQVGIPDINQIVYLVSKKELVRLTFSYEVICL